MKVAMVETGGWGGIAHYTWNLCEALVRGGTDVVLLTNTRYELAGLTRHFHLQPHFDGRIGYLRTAAGFLRHLSNMAPDIVHVQDAISTRFDALLWPIVRRRIPLVYTVHNVRSHESAGWENWTVWRTVRAAHGVVAHTQESAQALMAKVPRAVVRVVHHGDYSFFGTNDVCDKQAARRRLNLPETGQILLTFGAIRPYKGILELISVLPEVRRRCPTVHLVVAGPLLVGNEAEYHQAIQRAGMERAVTFHARYVPHADVATYFSAADVAVYNYCDVTDSGALRIACSLGVPVVATAVGAFAEFLRDGATGRLVPPHAPTALATALCDILEDRKAAMRMAEAAQTLSVSQWSWQDSARQTVSLYEAVMIGKRGGPGQECQ